MASSDNIGLTFNFTRLAIALQKINNVTVVSESNEEEKGLFEELVHEGIRCHAIHDTENSSIRKTVSVAGKIGRIIDNDNIDVIHAQGIRHMIITFIACKFFSHKKGKAIAVSVHTTLHGRPYEKVAPLVESFLLNICADIVMPVSKATAKKLVSLGLFPSKVVPVHNGIDLKLFDMAMRGNEEMYSLPHDFKSSSCVVVGYSAKLVMHKGHKYLIEAISEVAKEFPNIRLVITGDGPLRNELRLLSENLGIKDKVLFTGKVGYKSLYQLLKRIDIYAFPSLAELFPFAILEAMAAGKPIVATNVGGVSEAVIDGVNGFIVPPRDPESLAKAILKLINDPEKVKEMGKNSRKLIEDKFDLPKIACELTRCYGKLVSGQARAPFTEIVSENSSIRLPPELIRT
jgi:glycosyltransferase involved in cell wall biosynthesis